ncbi:hypothetical protein GX888_00540 [Candidatus Dojkabacteria bacterium]|uniref:Uncharacterized protein n=1 Tax=Candidatus Dojkabacteria bacterium TaxID=2099670 RepID=A0A847VCD9_9BACT|nr:hypothetical protein [Candidatus Dojkabacteria bacterium]
MSPTFVNRDGTIEWYPEPESAKKPTINLGHRNEKSAFIGTVNSVTRMMDLASQESPIITEEDVQECLTLNAEHLGITKELLLSLALEELERKIEEE